MLRPAIKLSRERFFATMCTIALFAFLLCRGVLELMMPKPHAMMLQLAAVSGCLLVILTSGYMALRRRQELWLYLSIAFFIIAIVSALLTSVLQSFHSWQTYLLFSGYVLFTCLVGISSSYSVLVRLPLPGIMLVWGWVLVFVGYIQIGGFCKMPGASLWMGGFVRAPSLTGSFLHFPIISAIFAFAAFQWYQLAGEKKYLFSGLMFAFAPFAVVSRSGMFIVIFAVLLIWLHAVFQGSRLSLWLGFCFIVVAGALYIAFEAYQDTILGKVALRIFTSSQANASGNSGRITAWTEGLKLWYSSNLLLGEFTGIVTNSAHHVLGGRTHIVESGVLQQLINFGFVGLILYYSVLCRVYVEIAKQHAALRYLFIACMVQTLFYQSIEVVPFITLLALMPLISKSYIYHSMKRNCHECHSSKFQNVRRQALC